MPLLKKFIVCLLMLFPGKYIPGCSAQDFFSFMNFSRLYVYDRGAIRQLDHLPITSYKSGYSFAAYTTGNRMFKVSSRRSTEVLSDFIPRRNDSISYHITGHMMAWVMNQTLFGYWEGKKTILAAYGGEFSVSDSLIAFYDRVGMFNVFYRGYVRELDRRVVRTYNLAKNLLAFTNENLLFKVYYNDSLYNLDGFEPRSYKTGLNTIAYVDNFYRFRIFHKGNIYNIDEQEPTQYFAGDDIVIWTNRNWELWAFYNGMMYKLETYIPKDLQLREGVAWYRDGNNYFHAFCKGSGHTLETYYPTSIQVRNNVLGYLDRWQNLKVLRDGKVTNVSSEMVTGYGIPGDVIWYEAQARDLVIVDKTGSKVRVTLSPR
jgi:hypothetical protein